MLHKLSHNVTNKTIMTNMVTIVYLEFCSPRHELSHSSLESKMSTSPSIVPIIILEDKQNKIHS